MDGWVGWFRDEQRLSIFMVLELCGGGDLNSIIQQRHEKVGTWARDRSLLVTYPSLTSPTSPTHLSLHLPISLIYLPYFTSLTSPPSGASDALLRGASGVVHLPAAVRGGETPARARHHPPRPEATQRVLRFQRTHLQDRRPGSQPTGATYIPTYIHVMACHGVSWHVEDG